MKCIIGVESEPRIQFTIETDPSNMPDMIVLQDGEKLIYVGKYASPGHTYRYNRVVNIYHHYDEVKWWKQYTELKG